jgi:SAM-dependent methyltransferase
MTTDILRDRTPRLTSIEIDPRLADTLKYRLQDTNVTVVEGDATAMPFADGSFSGAVSFTMLHHVPSPALQDRLLAEVYRALKPGGVFAGSDSRWNVGFRLRRVRPDGKLDEAITVAPSGTARSNGFPQMARAGGELIFAWTGGRVFTSTLALPQK